MKITLLGDSIRLLGYGKRVTELLGEDFTVFNPSDNGRFARYTLRTLYDWRKEMEGSELVHWNNGLWDTCSLFDEEPFTPVEEYCSTMVRIAEILKQRYGKVIFSTTTPVRKERTGQNNEVIRRYNEALVPLLRERGVIVNDLFTPVMADVDRYICDDYIHLSEEGIELCAERVAGIIRQTAGK